MNTESRALRSPNKRTMPSDEEDDDNDIAEQPVEEMLSTTFMPPFFYYGWSDNMSTRKNFNVVINLPSDTARLYALDVVENSNALRLRLQFREPMTNVEKVHLHELCHEDAAKRISIDNAKIGAFVRTMRQALSLIHI